MLYTVSNLAWIEREGGRAITCKPFLLFYFHNCVFVYAVVSLEAFNKPNTHTRTLAYTHTRTLEIFKIRLKLSAKLIKMENYCRKGLVK